MRLPGPDTAWQDGERSRVVLCSYMVAVCSLHTNRGAQGAAPHLKYAALRSSFAQHSSIASVAVKAVNLEAA
jgi:hypothetical protein